uniref:DNA topoisomerase 2-binding protein 1-like n=1 Tax=Phallusia mammillata TaxID=59560 RepID=A0A6F9DUR5_9ASCI|nr:DNA topoisomerase 2-binding protein 1-like [Phallusia mammillata]
MTSNNEVRLLALSEEGKENVDAVHKMLTEQNLQCNWIDAADALFVEELEDDVIYVVDPTDGKEVEHLVKIGFTVIGPQCAMTILKHNKQLKGHMKYPVYNLTMMGTLVCFSNIQPKERTELMNKVERMGGQVTCLLSQDATHLVVKEVGSVKYFSAAHVKIPIMTVDWIEHLWKHGQSRYISAKDGKWEEFKCPIFLGCSVSVTGFGTTERSSIQKLITKFGGKYSGSMQQDVTTHLIVHKPEGQKFAMASKFGVKAVNVKWVYDSVEKGSCQNHAKYTVTAPPKAVADDSRPASSTPESSRINTRIPSIHDMSNISVMAVNETVSTTIADMSRLSTIHPLNTSTQVSTLEDLWKFPMTRHFEQVLDGLCVYVTGFTAKDQEKLKKVLSLSGATRLNQMTPSVTHVIIGSASLVPEQLVSNLQNELKSHDRELWVVTYKWVLECMLQVEMLNEAEYWASDVIPKPSGFDQTVSDLPSMDDTTIMRRFRNTPLPPATSHDVTNDVSDMHDVLSQYMAVGGREEEGDTSLMKNFDLGDEMQPAGGAEETCVEEGKDTTQWMFRGKTFHVVGFSEEENDKCVEAIESLEGRILPSYSKRIADYAVVPITGWPVEKTVQHIVTDFWVELCMSNQTLEEPYCHPMCTPFLVPEGVQPLDDCVMGLSRYQEPERSQLVGLISELGGMYQDNVARTDVPGSNLRRTTHLIVVSPEGDKYKGCKKWGIPCITAEWVYECARKGRKVSESDFSVDKPRPPTPNETMQVDVTNADVKSETTDAPEEPREPNKSYDPEFPPIPRPPNPQMEKIRKRLAAKRLSEEEEARKAAMKRAETPLREKVLRLNVETPSKWMGRDCNPHISFDLDEVFEMLKTPVRTQQEMREAIENNPETPLSEFVERFLAENLRNAPEIGQIVSNLDSQLRRAAAQDEGIHKVATKKENNSSADETKLNGNALVDETVIRTTLPSENSQTDIENSKPLQGVVVYVCKKLSKQRMELSATVRELGGEFRWTYDAACTHFIFQGKQNDTNREFRSARTDEKRIVSPHWVTVCAETMTRADESSFPHVYDPNKSIQMKRTSPQKSRKRSDRSMNKSKLELSKIDTTVDQSSLGTSSMDLELANLPSAMFEPPQRVEDSQEARDNLRKTLENIMSSTTGVAREQPAQRLSCSRTGNFSSPANAPQRRAVVTPVNPMAKKNSPNSAESDKPESSQDVQVVWDDPIRREEMERLKKVEDSSNQTPVRAPSNTSNSTTTPNTPTINQSKSVDESIPLAQNSRQNTSITDPNRLSQILREGRVPAFLVSSVTPEQKADYAAVIESLGGIYLDRDYFDPSCTHLIMKRPVRNEKYLASLSSGKWILSTSYIEACKEAGSFVKEEPHEYGNPSARWSSLSETEELLVASAYRWRSRLNEKRASNEEVEGAFVKWRVVMHVSERHGAGFVRLLQSGGGKVLSRALPYHGPIGDVTHAIIDVNRVKQLPGSELEALVRANVHCCVPEYIADFLMKDPQPDPEMFYLPQAKAILESVRMEAPSKRLRLL